ncbi:hypothetical protein EOE18_16815 [Novosphingobium umbonatum]|uniref:Sulfotransferase family protein n=1 Tax=Novosphingobium umbonatum TaxID=1908524 RepID=A0A437N094_9SPHN|nr:hypothetical protein [Novosphingobium umbonatum]RVU03274.1 hypothetical protein EOE18_16815 [Novosphingobium umbonatum]
MNQKVKVMVGVDLEEKQSRKRQAVLVLGMHRSGTSALTRVLSLLGCALPKTLMPENPTNPAGHWESWPVAEFNDEVLSAAGSDWQDWLPVNEHFHRSLAYPDFVKRGGEVLAQEFGEAPLFALKDPRICRLTQFWLDILEQQGIEPAIVVPLRNPLEVADSLCRRDGTESSIGLMMWLRHVLDVEKATRGRARVFVSYAQLLQNWGLVVDKIARSLDVVWPRQSQTSAAEISAFLTRDLRHNHHADAEVLHNPLIAGWVSRLFQILMRWAEGAESKADYAAIDSVRDAFDEAGPLFSTPLANLSKARRDLDEQLRNALNRGDELQRHIDDVQRQLAEQHNVVAALVQERDALAVQRDHAAQERDGLEHRAHELSQGVAAIQDQAQGLQSALDHALHECRTAEQRVAELSGQIASTQEHAQTLQNSLDHALDARQDAEHRAADLNDQLASTQEHAQALQNSLDQALDARQDAERRAADLNDQLALAQEHAQTLQGALDASLEERGHLLHRLGELESALLQRQEEARQVWSELEQTRDQRDSAIAQGENAVEALRQSMLAEIDGLQQEVGRAERHAAAEIAQLQNMLDNAQAAMAAMEHAHRAALAEEVGKSAVEQLRLSQILAQVEQQRADREQEIATDNGRIYEMLRQVEAEARSLREELNAQQASPKVAAEHAQALADLRAQHEVMIAQKQQADRELADRFTEIAALTNMLREQEQRLAQLAEQKAQIEGLAHDRDQWLQQRDREVADLHARAQSLDAALGQKAQELASLAQGKHQAEQQLSERFGEIATLTSLMRTQERKAQQAEQDREWLQLVHRAMDRKPWWWPYMPKEWQRARIAARLARRGLFDADAYIARYPDVAQSGMDPLRHYMLHGIGEGRSRG